ncbi:hypothetical protein [Pseudomonas putida]|nr:hypothetical protein [Pseudomonas putida]
MAFKSGASSSLPRLNRQAYPSSTTTDASSKRSDIATPNSQTPSLITI